MVPLLLCCGMLLTGCQTIDRMTTEYVAPKIDQRSLTCEAAPKWDPKNKTQADVAQYILELYQAWESCHGNLAAVKKSLEEFQKEFK